ncbi:MAG: galactokinase [Candidatus Izemoplasmatales bacterium]|nr:galactokinase [Candidatus Izemoplasmatales bacterium]
MRDYVRKRFLEEFAEDPSKYYFSPGRVNIIGEHTDYNGGLVMPFTIDKGIYAGTRRSDEMFINIFSDNYPLEGIINIPINIDNYDLEKNFGDYVRGILDELRNDNIELSHGLDIFLASNLPSGGGLSSSAALSVLILRVINDEFKLGLTQLDIVKKAKSVENNFLGVNCGVMDQFAVVFGKEKSCILLDTVSLKYDYLNLDFEDYEFVLINSNTVRKLKESKYNDRQIETQKALSILKKHYDINYLCDLNLNKLNEALAFIDNEVLKRRVKHVVSENDRVKQIKEAIERKDLDRFGEILFEAHESLKKDYEVSSELLDNLVDIAKESGALGARMVGGGFGGSVLTLVLKNDLKSFLEKFKKHYQRISDKNFIYSIVYAKDGIKEID